jgi:undecaprenyl-diphosphatase
MTILQAIVLGIVQGLTEFLPVSSSGHLVIVPVLLGWEIPEDQAFVFDVLVQIGTLAAVIVYFWSDLLAIARAMGSGVRDRRFFEDPDARLGWHIVLATIPAGLGGLLLKDQVEAAFTDPGAVAVFLLITAGLLVLAERVGRLAKDAESLSALDAFLVGCFQVLSLFPGVSRSGSTIAGGITRGLRRDAAARFAFLMSVPIMLAAGLLSLFDLAAVADPAGFLPALVTGMAVSAATGYLAIAWLLRFLRSRPLYGFAVYVTLLAAALFFLI